MIASGGAAAHRALVVLVTAIVLAGVPFAVTTWGGVGVLGYAPYAGIGALLALRRPRNPIGWLLIGFSWTFLFSFAPQPATVAALRAGTAPAFEMLIAWSSAWLPTTGFLILVVVMIIFPTGQMPIGRWRGPAIVAMAAAAFAVLLAALVPTFKVTTEGQVVTLPNAFTFVPDTPPWDWLTEAFPYPVFVGLLIAGMASMVVRARRATGQERQQLRWVVAAFAALTCSVPFGFAVLIAFGDGAAYVAWLPAIISITLPPIAICIAILRYRLYEIDRIISRTIGYAVVSVILGAVFLVGVFAGQAVLSGVVGDDSTVAVAASTLVAFALFQPLRRRVQAGVDRWFHRARIDAERTSEMFAARLRDEVDLAALRSVLVTTASDAVRPVRASVWIRADEGGR